MKHTKLIASCILSGIALTAAVLTSTASTSYAYASHSHNNETVIPSRLELAAELANLGYIPEYLCAAGLNASDSSTLLPIAEEALTDQWVLISTNRETVTNTNQELNRLSRIIKNGNASPKIESEYKNSSAERDAAQAQLDAAAAAIRAKINTKLSYKQITTLDRIVANRKQPLPTQYLVLEYTQSEWTTFCKAYSECQTNPKPSKESQGIVNAADMIYAVNLAQIQLDTNLASIKQVYKVFIATP